MRVPGGLGLLPGCGASGDGRSPTPISRPLGRAAGAHYPLAVGAGGAGVGTRQQPHRVRSCVLWGRHEGARGGGRLLPGCGASRGRALSHPRPPVLSGVRPGPAYHWPWMRCAGVGARLSLAPCPVPRFVVCCARFPGSRHPVAVVAWHLSLCRGFRRRRASLACLEAPRWCAAPRPVPSPPVLQSVFSLPWCLPPPRGLSPPALLSGCAGHVETTENQAHCVCRWPLPRQGRWARSASYLFGARRWGCPWRVPPASVLGCVRCGGLACVDPVTDASGFPYRPSCDGGLVWAETGLVFFVVLACGRLHVSRVCNSPCHRCLSD